MPFFTNAEDVKITNTAMNDVGGDYKKTTTETKVINNDSNNVNKNSTVKKGNVTNQSATAGEYLSELNCSSVSLIFSGSISKVNMEA